VRVEWLGRKEEAGYDTMREGRRRGGEEKGGGRKG